MARWMRTFLLLILGVLLITAPIVRATGDTDGDGDADADDATAKTDAAGAGAGAAAEEGEGAEAGQTKEAEHVFTTSFFPDHQERRIPAGTVVQTLIGFDNQNSADSFNIEYIRGFLTSTVDFKHYIQNFTGSMYNATVAPGEEASLLFRFKPDQQLDPREYGLVIEVYYSNNANDTFLSTVYNATVTITDPQSGFDAETLFAHTSLVGVLGLAGFGIYKYISNKRARTRRAPQKVVATGTQDIDWDFVSSEHLKFAKQNAKRPGKPSSPKGPKSPKSPKKH